MSVKFSKLVFFAALAALPYLFWVRLRETNRKKY
jgi:hypothetical protein